MFNSKYLSRLKLFEKVNKKILAVNPTLPPSRKEPPSSIITVTEYNSDFSRVEKNIKISDFENSVGENKITWINVDGLRKSDVEKIGAMFKIHPLLIEDIISNGQRPKVDEMKDIIFTLIYMLNFNQETNSVETEQVSIILGKNFVLSYQEFTDKNLFNNIREKIAIKESKFRSNKADYLFYALIDAIVDNYFVIMEKLGERIEFLEEEIVQHANTVTLTRINILRKEMILLKRNITPVRELVNSLLRTDSLLIDDKTEKYFKDVYDHIVQASELSENYRDMMMNLHDLYLSELNLKMNEVMKVMAIVTCLLAPATVIGGIFGMNFSRMPWLKNPEGFYLAVAFMLLIPVVMIYLFKKRGWF
ncbi:MAG: magnesium/cobalt transporter CorA [Chitinophagaceae bacterium]|nr:magnesium/cobalt transporter CorA [Chitinophagaceae bacterium]